jgi:pyruvate formate lyase activating enzyme
LTRVSTISHPFRIDKSGDPETPLTRREFLEVCGTAAGALCFPCLLGSPGALQAQTVRKGLVKTRLSSYFTPIDTGEIRCELCPRRCRIAEGKRGFCRVRENRNGKLYSLVYGNPCVVHLDPVERTPLFHVLPGTDTLSVATAGCNFHCRFCQNWEFSQAFPEEVYAHDFPPQRVVDKAGKMGARSVAYTYVEPAVFYEYMLDVGYLANRSGLLNVLHSNGFINPAPLRELCPVLNAAHIDLKGFTEDFYRRLCKGRLAPVLGTLRTLRENGVHLEITNLVIPTQNDDMSVVREMCLWVVRELGADIPFHFTRFYPLYRLTKLPPTPVATLEKARETALSVGLEYVYIGNVPGHDAWNTFCPGCRSMVIQRTGYVIREIRLDQGKCFNCGRPIPGIWD